jgi:hypothetical protein
VCSWGTTRVHANSRKPLDIISLASTPSVGTILINQLSISYNLAVWLKPHAKNSGLLNPCEEHAKNVGNALGDRFKRAAARAKVAWKRNGFRHSYISYRVAKLKDVPAVALACGNSPQVIFSSYRALTTDAEAKAWFSILPLKRVGNMVPLQAAANA